MAALHSATGVYRHVIWDWNGTLLDDTGLCVDIVNELLVERGVQTHTLEQHRELFEFPVVKFYERAGFDLAKETFEELSVHFIAGYQRRVRQLQLHGAAKGLLQKLQSAGVEQSVLSAARQDHLEDLVTFFGVRDCFGALNGTDTIFARGKIQRGQDWVGQLSCGRNEVLLIGDTLHDYEVAHAIGVDCWLVGCGANSVEKLSRVGVPVFEDLDALAEILCSATVQKMNLAKHGCGQIQV